MEPNEALKLARDELRHLQETVAILRERLEGAQSEADARVRQVKEEMDRERRELQAMIGRLREELEDVAEQGLRKLDEAKREQRAEVRQYRETIRVLREQLEAEVAEKKAE